MIGGMTEGSGTPAHRPRMPADRVERIRRWHERAYRASSAPDRPVSSVSYFGHTILVPSEVQPVTPVSDLLGGAVLAEAREGDRVLDMGTGSGVNAILAASRAESVLAVDTNPKALRAAEDNARRNGVADRVEVRHSDVFSEVEGRFDLIVFDPPFRWFRPRSLFETAITDENYGAMNRFFGSAREHLTENGRMLIFFGTSGDLDHLIFLADEAGFDRTVVAERSLTKDGWTVEYLTFRMTPR
ncbi:methyltransferase [Saccharomonospora xinjiangensis]|uniref:methyltransferase n=1 Tax=Saccharomonospora xinjiangensis TaxID=75294 RepID=UPI001070384F|nr:Ribosomal protein L11 methyltransferase [Saccharomonospora xinjiangensis]